MDWEPTSDRIPPGTGAPACPQWVILSPCHPWRLQRDVPLSHAKGVGQWDDHSLHYLGAV